MTPSAVPALTRLPPPRFPTGLMCDLIESECEKAEADLLAACRQSLAHGALLATRYMLAEMAFNSQKKDVRAALKV